MSTDSPAKKERIERHLMRQRGAGVRTVSATFGFAFGSSAPSSQEHTPVSIEPPAKRRKTVLRIEIGVSDDSGEAAAGYQAADHSTEAKKRKPRKRWAPDDDDADSIVRSHTVDEDDSFIGGLKAAKTAAKKSARTTTATKRKRDIELAVESPTTKPKPRRRAAADAIGKVADVVVEEGRTQDARQRDIEISTTSKQPKRTRRKQEGPTGVSFEPSKNIDPSTLDVRSKATARKSKQKQNPAAQAGLEESRPLQSNRHADSMKEPDHLEPKVTKAVSRKRKHCDGFEDVDIADKTEVIASEKTENKASSRTKTVQRTVVQPTQETRRVPLKESDPNVTVHAASPDKSNTKPRRATSTRSNAVEVVKPAEPVQRDQPKASKRRKVQVLDDEQTVDTSVQDSGSRANAAAHEKSKHRKQSAPTQVAQARDEDIDWLFQDPNSKQHASLAGKRLAPPKKGPRTPKKLADIDLDDLLSNIASFAKVENEPRMGIGRTDQDQTVEMTANVPKRRARR